MRNKKQTLSKIRTKKSKIAVIGLGYVGLPLAILFAKKGFHVTGYAKTPKKILDIKTGNTEFTHLNSTINRLLNTGKFSAELITSQSLKNNDIIIICLPTPVDSERKPDISSLLQVAKHLSKIPLTNKLIVNESTVAPFTTEKIYGKLGDKYYLACSPERVDPGVNLKSTENIPKLIGGIDKDSLEVALALYKHVIKAEIVPVKNMHTAEMSKMMENTYRAVNIALSNEFAILADSIGIDVLQVIEAAKSKWSYQAHYPGIGVGGHCIPVDPYYVIELAEEKKLTMNVVKQSLKVNESMPDYVLSKIKKYYKKGMKVLIYGITYKKNIPDLRESPVIVLCRLLEKINIEFVVFDPLVDQKTIESLNFSYSTPIRSDIFIVGTDHDKLIIDSKKCITKKTIVIDGKNFFTNPVGKMVIGIGR